MRYIRIILLMITDMILINIAFLLAVIIDKAPWHYNIEFFLMIFLISLLKMLICVLSGLYRSLWRYASDVDFIRIIIAVTIGCLISRFILGFQYSLSVDVITLLLTITLICCSRITYKILIKKFYLITHSIMETKRVLIIGAGAASSIIIRELRSSCDKKYKIIAAVDDNTNKLNRKIDNIPILGKIEDVPILCIKYKIDIIIIAMPSADHKRITEIVKICKTTKCKLKILPKIKDIIDPKVTTLIRDVDINDLLKRDEVKFNNTNIKDHLSGKVVLITGGGGSIGSELCRQVSECNLKKLIILDNYENTTYELQNELLQKIPGMQLDVVIASIREKDRLNDVFNTYRPDIVFHTAAHKHVPLMEGNPQEAIKNNVFGTLNLVECADAFGVKKFVLISTDKAVNPTSIMGASKRVAEMIIQSKNPESKTDFVAVRFGNVLGSNGSVIPLFKKQIANGGPVTVTHPKVTRFFMTIPEATRLVIEACTIAQGGEIFVLDMGSPVLIYDLAKSLIDLSGAENIDIIFTGLKPGEKLYEELLLKEEGIKQQNGVFIAPPLELCFEDVLEKIKLLEENMFSSESIRRAMKMVVPKYQYGE